MWVCAKKALPRYCKKGFFWIFQQIENHNRNITKENIVNLIDFFILIWNTQETKIYCAEVHPKVGVNCERLLKKCNTVCDVIKSHILEIMLNFYYKLIPNCSQHHIFLLLINHLILNIAINIAEFMYFFLLNDRHPRD